MIVLLAKFKRDFASFIADEDGLTTVEYAILLALLVVVAIGTWSIFGAKVRYFVEKAGWCVT